MPHTTTKSIRTPRLLRRAMKATADWIVAAIAIFAAFLLRYDGALPDAMRDNTLAIVVGVATMKVVVLLLFGEYLRIWRYASLNEAMVLAAGAASSALLLEGGQAVMGWAVVPTSVVLIDAAVSLLGFGFLRFARRVQVARTQRRGRSSREVDARRTLILGAGDGANALLTDLERRGDLGWDLIGLLDDDPAKQGEMMRGLPVLGSTAHLEAVVRKHGVEHVIIAMPRAPKMVLRGLITRSQSVGATVQAVPALERLLRDGSQRNSAVIKLSDLQDSAEVKRSLLPRVQRVGSERMILVTGGAGYIGSHLVNKLLDRGFRVRVLDNFTYGDEPIANLRSHPRLEVRHGDISSVRDVVSAVKDVDTVIALAAIVGDPACGIDPEETLNLNYESTKILVEACNFYGVDRLVFASSCSVYGAAQSELLTEASPLNPVSLYARTRILSEEILRERCGDVTIVTLRLATVFGLSPRMRFDLVVNTLTARAIVDRKIQIFGGDQWRPFVHCQDVAEAFAMAAVAPKALVDGEIFNVGSTNMNYTLAALGDIVAEVVGPDVRVDHGDFTEDRRNYKVSFDKIERELGWHASHTLQSGIREMVEAISGNAALQDYGQARYSNLKYLTNRMSGGNLQLIDATPSMPKRRASGSVSRVDR